MQILFYHTPGSEEIPLCFLFVDSWLWGLYLSVWFELTFVYIRLRHLPLLFCMQMHGFPCIIYLRGHPFQKQVLGAFVVNQVTIAGDMKQRGFTPSKAVTDQPGSADLSTPQCTTDAWMKLLIHKLSLNEQIVQLDFKPLDLGALL